MRAPCGANEATGQSAPRQRQNDKRYCGQSVPRAPPGTTTSAALTTKKCIFSGTTLTIISDHIASEYTCELLILKLLDKTQPILCMWCSSVLMTFFLFLLPLAPSDRASLVRFKSSERSPPCGESSRLRLWNNNFVSLDKPSPPV